MTRSATFVAYNRVTCMLALLWCGITIVFITIVVAVDVPVEVVLVSVEIIAVGVVFITGMECVQFFSNAGSRWLYIFFIEFNSNFYSFIIDSGSHYCKVFTYFNVRV